MTAEVAILNKTAVALATDSAVTITSNDGQKRTRKIYVDANKLFELVKSRPIGVMIYDSAEFSGIPWENIIKYYRQCRGDVRFDRLEEYARDLITFLSKNVYELMPASSRARQAGLLLMSMVIYLHNSIAVPVIDQGLGKRETRRVVTAELDRIFEGTKVLPIQPWAAELDERKLLGDFKPLASLIPELFDVPNLTFTKSLAERYLSTALCGLLRLEQLAGTCTGLVVAGFGERELYPSLFHANIYGIFEGRTVALGERIDGITDDRTSIISPYAQTGEARTFLSGIDPSVSAAVSGFWESWSNNIAEVADTIVRKTAESLDDEVCQAIEDKMRAFMQASWERFADFMQSNFHDKRLGSIEASASFLSKGEIASLAESLIDLTSLRDRVSLDRQETVGGATDVAVVSRGDGFVWVKRKHYFDLKYNPTWPARQVAGPAINTAGSSREGE